MKIEKGSKWKCINEDDMYYGGIVTVKNEVEINDSSGDNDVVYMIDNNITGYTKVRRFLVDHERI